MMFNTEDVKSYLPHRAPFLFIDEVTHVKVPDSYNQNEIIPKEMIGGVVKASFHVKNDLDILQGHFPGAPILPGVVQVEMMGQASAFLFKAAYENLVKDKKIKVQLLGVDNARFKQAVIPSQKLFITAELKKVRGIIQSYDCQIFNEHEKLVSQASILASLEFREI